MKLIPSRQADRAAKAEPAPPADGESLARISESYGLSRREAEVFELLLQGRSRQYIQERLFIADGTVKTHITRIYKKMGVRNKQEMLSAVLDGERERVVQMRRTPSAREDEDARDEGNDTSGHPQ